MPWRVEILNEAVAAEIAALPADMQARFIRLAERIVSVGLEKLSEPHVKHIEGKLWELRLTGRDGIARALYVTAVGQGSSWSGHSRRRHRKHHARKSNWRYGEQGKSSEHPV